MAFLDPVLTPLMQPLLNYDAMWSIILLAFVISVLITLAYKFFTNQAEMKRLKERQKEFSKRIKELKGKPDEMMKVQKEAMAVNMEYMKHSFKAMLITMLPILLIFGWMNAHLDYLPIEPDQTYVVEANFAAGVTGEAILEVGKETKIINNHKQKIEDKTAIWRIRSAQGEHLLKVKVGDEIETKKVLVTKEQKYLEPTEEYKNSAIETINVVHDRLRVDLGFWSPTWLWAYIIFSLVFSMATRKMMKVY